MIHSPEYNELLEKIDRLVKFLYEDKKTANKLASLYGREVVNYGKDYNEVAEKVRKLVIDINSLNEGDTVEVINV